MWGVAFTGEAYDWPTSLNKKADWLSTDDGADITHQHHQRFFLYIRTHTHVGNIIITCVKHVGTSLITLWPDWHRHFFPLWNIFLRRAAASGTKTKNIFSNTPDIVGRRNDTGLVFVNKMATESQTSKPMTPFYILQLIKRYSHYFSAWAIFSHIPTSNWVVTFLIFDISLSVIMDQQNWLKFFPPNAFSQYGVRHCFFHISVGLVKSENMLYAMKIERKLDV